MIGSSQGIAEERRSKLVRRSFLSTSRLCAVK